MSTGIRAMQVVAYQITSFFKIDNGMVQIGLANENLQVRVDSEYIERNCPEIGGWCIRLTDSIEMYLSDKEFNGGD